MSDPLADLQALGSHLVTVVTSDPGADIMVAAGAGIIVAGAVTGGTFSVPGAILAAGGVSKLAGDWGVPTGSPAVPPANAAAHDPGARSIPGVGTLIPGVRPSPQTGAARAHWASYFGHWKG